MVLVVKKWVICLILLIVALSGCTDQQQPVANASVNQTPTPTPTPAFTVPEPSTVYVEIIGLTFNPPELKVIKGTIVKWKNMDSAQHTINGDGFNSPPLNKRETWSYTFNRTGTFEYHCSNYSAMPHGRIIVG